MIQMIGCKYHLLTVLEQTGHTKNGKLVYLCRCDCGRTVETSGEMLRSGKRKSCGCRKGERHKIHGMTDSRLYTIWRNMKARCLNPHERGYKNYGARGIFVCAEWESGFEKFMHWALANGYDETLEIDRIDVNGNYCPENCRFVTEDTQANNKRNNIKLTVDGVTKTIPQFAKEYNISKSTVRNRIVINGMSAKEALTKPPRNRKIALCKLTGTKQPDWIRGGKS